MWPDQVFVFITFETFDVAYESTTVVNENQVISPDGTFAQQNYIFTSPEETKLVIPDLPRTERTESFPVYPNPSQESIIDDGLCWYPDSPSIIREEVFVDHFAVQEKYR